MEQQFNTGFDAMLPIIDQMSANFNLDNDAKDELTNIYRSWFNEDLDRSVIMSKMKQIYSNTFTEKEMQGLIAFYQTPLGQEVLKTTPELTQQGSEIGMLEAQSKQQLLMDRLKPFFEKYNIK